MNTSKEIIEKIKKENKIIILRHILPDGDAYGFQFGMKKLIELNWPGKSIKISGHKNERLNFIGNNFDEIKDEEFKESLVIVGDTANTQRIDEHRWNLGKFVIKIDHHPNREAYGDIMYIKEDYVATCEILGEMIIEHNLKINKDIARIIYHGIVTDSNRFLVRFPKARTLRIAAFLLDQGFDLEELYMTMYKKTQSDLNFISYVYQNFKKSLNGVGYLFLDRKTCKKLNISADFAAYENVNLLTNIEGIPVFAFFCEYEDKQLIRCELRSNQITINQVAVKWGGGGHATSCGVLVSNFDEAKKIVDDLDKVILESKQNIY